MAPLSCMVLAIHDRTGPPRLSTAPAQVALSSGLIFSRFSDWRSRISPAPSLFSQAASLSFPVSATTWEPGPAGAHRPPRGAPPAGGAAHDDRPVGRPQAVLLHAHDADARGEAGGAERHRLPQRHAARQRDQPVAGHARVLRVAAVVRDAEVVAHAEHRIALRKPRIAR